MHRARKVSFNPGDWAVQRDIALDMDGVGERVVEEHLELESKELR